MKQLQKIINLHPSSNPGESTSAIVDFDTSSRTLSLNLHMHAYGNHMTSILVNFDSPREMSLLAKTLKEVADKADEFLKDNS